MTSYCDKNNKIQCQNVLFLVLKIQHHLFIKTSWEQTKLILFQSGGHVDPTIWEDLVYKSSYDCFLNFQVLFQNVCLHL